MALLDDILAAQAKAKANPYATANGSTAVQGIDNTDNANLLDTLNQLYQTSNSKISGYNNQLSAVPTAYQPTYDTLNTSLSNAKTENQDVLNQNAVSMETALKNIREEQANNGNLMSGQTPILQLNANSARQNNDTKVYNQRAADTTNFQNQLVQTQAKQKSDEDAIRNSISSLENNGETDLASLLSQYAQKHTADVRNQQANEAAAAAKAAYEQQQLAEQQYAAQLAAQSKLQAAQIGANASMSNARISANASASKPMTTSQLNSTLNSLINTYKASVADNGASAKYGVSLDANGNYTRISNPDALISRINALPITSEQKETMLNSIPYTTVSKVTHGLVSLPQYLSEVNSLNSSASASNPSRGDLLRQSTQIARNQ